MHNLQKMHQGTPKCNFGKCSQKLVKKFVQFLQTNFNFFFAFLLLLYLRFLKKNHHIVYSRGTSINFELSNVQIRQKLDKKCKILKSGDFFPKLHFRALRGIFGS